jgi:hypothetical protein
MHMLEPPLNFKAFGSRNMTSFETFSQGKRIDLGEQLYLTAKNLQETREHTSRLNDKLLDTNSHMSTLVERADSLLLLIRIMLLMQVVSTAALVASLFVLPLG